MFPFIPSDFFEPGRDTFSAESRDQFGMSHITNGAGMFLGEGIVKGFDNFASVHLISSFSLVPASLFFLSRRPARAIGGMAIAEMQCASFFHQLSHMLIIFCSFFLPTRSGTN